VIQFIQEKALREATGNSGSGFITASDLDPTKPINWKTPGENLWRKLEGKWEISVCIRSIFPFFDSVGKPVESVRRVAKRS